MVAAHVLPRGKIVELWGEIRIHIECLLIIHQRKIGFLLHGIGFRHHEVCLGEGDILLYGRFGIPDGLVELLVTDMLHTLLVLLYRLLVGGRLHLLC